MKLFKRIVIIALILVATYFFLEKVFNCPLRVIFHIACPGCGLTSACKLALKLKFEEAFTMHPLWLLMSLECLYLLFRITFNTQFNYNKKAEEAAFWTTTGIMLVTYFIRMYFGVLPT